MAFKIKIIVHTEHLLLLMHKSKQLLVKMRMTWINYVNPHYAMSQVVFEIIFPLIHRVRVPLYEYTNERKKCGIPCGHIICPQEICQHKQLLA